MGKVGAGLLSLVGVFGLLILVGQCSGGGDPNSPERMAGYARENCREFIRRQLNDPSRAEWGNWMRWAVVPQASGALEVIASLRAPNAFGGIVAAVYSCTVIQDGRTSRLVALRQL